MREKKNEIKMDLYKLYEVNRDVRKNVKHPWSEGTCGLGCRYKEY